MNTVLSALALMSALSAPAQAQDVAAGDDRTPSTLAALAAPTLPPEEPAALPTSLAAPDPRDKEDAASFSIGAAGGYLNVRGADHGTWFGGVQARLHFARYLAAEAAITFHQNRYEDGDVVVTQYPLQLTAFLYIIPEGPIRPYILGGVGWYYTRVDYRDQFAPLFQDRTEHIFGEHLGFGGELMLGSRTSLDLDARYVFLNPTNDKVIHRDYNYWQITFGLNFFF